MFKLFLISIYNISKEILKCKANKIKFIDSFVK